MKKKKNENENEDVKKGKDLSEGQVSTFLKKNLVNMFRCKGCFLSLS